MNSHKKYTHTLHNDSKETLVQIDKKLFKLVEIKETLDDIKKLPFNKTPHVRLLNPIQERTPQEQMMKSKVDESIHRLASTIPTTRRTINIRQAALAGIDLPKAIAELMEKKANAKTDAEKRAIRKQLRRLDYKRFLNNTEDKE